MGVLQSLSQSQSQAVKRQVQEGKGIFGISSLAKKGFQGDEEWHMKKGRWGGGEYKQGVSFCTQRVSDDGMGSLTESPPLETGLGWAELCLGTTITVLLLPPTPGLYDAIWVYCSYRPFAQSDAPPATLSF
jgi:hypothetical protein